MQDTYTWFRAFADSWVLLAMTLFYLGAIVLAFLPRSRAGHEEAAGIPFRNDTAAGAAGGCTETCATCTCQTGQARLTPPTEEDAA